MTCTRTDYGDETTLRIDGLLDALSTTEIRSLLDAVVADRRTRVFVELSELRLIDSSGVGAIVSLYKRVRSQGGDVRVVGLRDQPLQIFKLLRLDRVFAI